MPANDRSQWTLQRFENCVRRLWIRSYQVQKIHEHCRQPRTGVILLRHDIDRFPTNALPLARIEQRLGLASTYYTRMGRSVLNHEVLRGLRELGHEVGYHYEVLSRCTETAKRRGNYLPVSSPSCAQ